jgi:uncharacterized membrane protein (DUF373 family)
MLGRHSSLNSQGFLRFVHRGEMLISLVLATLLLVVTIVGTMQLVSGVMRDITEPSMPWLGSRLNALLGDLLTLLIALEVLQNITAFFRGGSGQIQLVLLTAITAVARKVIVLPPGADSKPQLLVGLGVAVLSLSAAYWLVSRPRTPIFPEPRTEQATPYRDRDPSPPPGDGARR